MFTRIIAELDTNRSRLHQSETAGALLTLEPAVDTNLDAAMALLFTTDNLYDQMDLLYYIASCRGTMFVIPYKKDSVTVADLLEEVYEKAAHHRLWDIVREAAGLLKKVVNRYGRGDRWRRRGSGTFLMEHVDSSQSHHQLDGFVDSTEASDNRLWC